MAVGKDAEELRARLQEVERSRLEGAAGAAGAPAGTPPPPSPHRALAVTPKSTTFPLPGAEAPRIFKTKGLNCKRPVTCL